MGICSSASCCFASWLAPRRLQWGQATLFLAEIRCDICDMDEVMFGPFWSLLTLSEGVAMEASGGGVIFGFPFSIRFSPAAGGGLATAFPFLLVFTICALEG